MTTTESLILLNMVEGLGIVRLRALLKVYETPQAILDNPLAQKLKTVEGIGDVISEAIVDMAQRDNGQWKKERLARELELIRANKVQVVTIFDENYPASLKQIYDPPMVLYIKGNIVPDDILAIAIVGSRRATYYGLSTTEKLASHLAAKGITVVSGLARGIDSAAHKGALKAKGRTIAVLGSGLGRIYPPENKKLAEQISGSGNSAGSDSSNRDKNNDGHGNRENNSSNFDINSFGAVISEFPYETIPDKKNFPMRNRIISGLSLGVVVVEAAQRSGSLITAAVALEQGREVFAVPGKIDSLSSGGTNNLIKQGAKLVQDADDILEELEPVLVNYLASLEQSRAGQKKGTIVKEQKNMSEGRKAERCDKGKVTAEKFVANNSSMADLSAKLKPAGLSQEEELTYNLLSSDPVYIDDITEKSSLPASKISGILIKLELKRLIKQLPGKMFVRN